MNEQVRIFVSHHHSPAEDAFTRRLVTDLQKAGHDVWVDFDDVTYDNFVKRINEGLSGRQWLILVMTPEALRSPWVNDEVNAALNQTRKGRMRGVIPIVAQPCNDADIPALWDSLQRYDATSDYQSALTMLLRALANPRNPAEPIIQTPSPAHAFPPIDTTPPSTRQKTTSFRPLHSIADFFDRLRSLLLQLASSLATLIKKVWSRDDILTRKRKEINDAINSEIELQSSISQKTPTEEQLQQIHDRVTQQYGEVSEPSEPSIGLLTQAWARRLIYLLLVIVCVGSNYVLVSSRVPFLFGGGEIPSFLRVLFQYLQVITGVLFVSIAALSGMLIQEYSTGLPDDVKLEPDIDPREKRIKLWLAVFMFILDVIVVIFLTLGGIFQQYLQQQDLEVIYIVFIGTSVLVAVGIFLAWTGLYQAVEALGSLILGGAVALVCTVLAFICSIVIAFLSLLDSMGVDRRDPAIIGFGVEGSNLALEVCHQVRQLTGNYARRAAIYVPDWKVAPELEARFKQTKVATHSKVIAYTRLRIDAAADLIDFIERSYKNKYRGNKPLLWIVAGNDLAPSLSSLQNLGKKENTQNIRLVIIWLVPEAREIDENIRAIAARLRAWAQDPKSILATTLVISKDSPLADTIGSQFSILLCRSIAALLTADVIDPDNGFASVAMQLKDAGYSFSALAAGAVGVDVSPQDFREGSLIGSRGDINPIVASERVRLLAEIAFAQQRLSIVTEALSAIPYVNLVVPKRLRLVREFQTEVSKWLRSDFSINQERVTVKQLANPRDHGIDISHENPEFTGDFYLHFTALRGIGTGHGEIPKDLQGGVSPSE